MKKTVFILLTSMAIGSSSFAKKGDIPYSTETIGNFMTFCVNVLGSRMMQNGMPQQVAIHHSSNVCACIMDSYRKNNEEAEFLFEFNTKDHENVHLFTQYLNQCMTVQFSQQEIDPKQSIVY